MLNKGIRTNEFMIRHWLLDPDVRDSDVVACMKLPKNLSVEELLVSEMSATADYQRAWSANCGLDTARLFLRNSACKRVLYLSAPIFLPDTMSVSTFVPAGVNTRIHLYQAPDPRDVVRLEAVSSYEPVRGMRFRYALSIQYAPDAVGQGWQVIRPVIILDRGMLNAVREQRLLEQVLEPLRCLVLTGSHDYVHATVLNWFPPPSNLPPEYAAILSERAHPPEIDEWHRGTQRSLPDGLLPGQPTPQIATLELYSLFMHTATIARMAEEDAGLLPHAAGLLAGFNKSVEEFARSGITDPAIAGIVPDYFASLACWFVLSAFPLHSELLAGLFKAAPSERNERALGRLAAVHDGMFELAARACPDQFPWQGEYISADEVTRQYEEALRGPALTEHAAYLSWPRCGADRRSWVETLAADDERVTVLRGDLEQLSRCTRQQERQRLLRQLADHGAIDVLRGAADAESSGLRGARYAQAIADDLARIAGATLNRFVSARAG
jgi:hypothetical protein